MEKESEGLFKLEFSVLLGDIEKMLKQGRKKEAMMKLVAARMRLNEARVDPELKERVGKELTKLRTKIRILDPILIIPFRG